MCGSAAVGALEGAAERFLGVVANAAGHRGDPEGGGGEEVFGHVDAPVGEVSDR